MQLPYELADSSSVDEQNRPKLSALTISPAYFSTLRSEVLSGREFDDTDGASGIPVIIVNQAFANKYWPGQSPLGKRLRLFDGKTPQEWLTVVGVASNIAQNAITQMESDPLVYLPYRQKPPHSGTVPVTFMYVIARTRIPPGSLATAFRREVQSMDPDLPIWTLSTLADGLEWKSRPSGINAILFLIFAAVALLLASGGLYAVIAHSMSQRTQEIGVRMAMGATTGDILTLVFKQGMTPAGIGLAIGLAASFAVNRVLKSQLVHVSPSDPITLMIAAAVLVLSAALGCWMPARRAMRVDPVVALRSE
jgi:predicted permease